MSQVSVKISNEIYKEIDQLRKSLIKKADFHHNLSIRETMDIAWNMKSLYGFNISEAIGHVKTSQVDIDLTRRGKPVKELTKKGRRKNKKNMNVKVNGRSVYPRNMLHQKRASSFDVLILVFFVLILGVTMIMIMNIWDNGIYKDPKTTGKVWNLSSETNSIGQSTDAAMGVMDFVVPTVMFMGIVIIAVLAYSNPIPAPFLIFGALFVFLIMYFANVFKHFYIDMLVNSAVLTGVVVRFPMTNLVLRNLAMYFLFLYVIIVIVQYARRDSVTG